VPFAPAEAIECEAIVAEHVDLSQRYFLLRLERPHDFPTPRAGQFVHVAIPDAGRFFLRRPFSIHDCSDDFIDLLIVELGPGTQSLRKFVRGDVVRFYGPLGGGFPQLDGQRVLAVGGGVGLAPLYFYGFRWPGKRGDAYRLCYGARTKDDLFTDHIDMESEGVVLSTDDGSYGYKGSVVALAREQLERSPADVIFSCGPTPMMKAVQRLAEEKGLRHFVSLENRMACALGACRACVVPTRLDGGSPYRTVCHDGPVFDGADLLWDELPTP